MWAGYFEEWEAGRNVRCPFHDDERPSLSLSEEGKGFCHGCGWKCSSVIGFVADFERVSYKKALKRLRIRFVGDVVPARDWTEWHKALLGDQRILKELQKVRGLGLEIVKKYKLGWHRNRLTIPIMDELGCCVNVRKHDALRRLPKGAMKMVSYDKKFGEARLFPLKSLSAEQSKVYLFEGELNTLLALQMGLNAACVTSGARVWKEHFTERFQNRKVVVCQDVNDPDHAGQEGALKKCAALSKVAAWVKNLKLPIQDRGGDLIDYVVKHGHDLNSFLELERSTPYYKRPSEKEAAGPAQPQPAVEVSLKEAAHSENFGKPILTKCLVASMDLAPYVPPKRIKLRCLEFQMHQAAGSIPPKCGACWMPEAGLEKELSFGPENREVIDMLGKNDVTASNNMRKMAGVPRECKIQMDVLEVHNVHAIGIIPDLHRERSGRHEYVLRTGYYFGRHMEANRSYEFTGAAISHPDTQQITHVFTKAESTMSEMERFKLEDKEALRLESLFGGPEEPYDRLMDIYADFSAHVTRIVRRPLLHAAADLVWHSPLQFYFNGEFVHKGWLEAVVFGDTRCGKGYVAEGLSRYYGLGEVVSGENCSAAGLVGGLETMGKRMVLRWGAIPLNDRGLVIIDEIPAQSQELFARLSRVRSEGVAEVTKIGHHQRTYARTRLIWLCNPVEGVMADYTYGVQALQQVVGKAEDIARFDYAFAVSDGEVPPDAINLARQNGAPSSYPADACRNLIYWAWSRKPKDVVFTDRAVADILKVHSPAFAAKYSPSIPLIQGQNIRIKLAKMAAAVAARLFRHPKGDRTKLLVDSKCADAAARLLDEFYKSAAMGYDSYSRKAVVEGALSHQGQLQQMFMERLRPKDALGLVRCLLSRRISVRSIAAAASMSKEEAEQSLLDTLLRANAVSERANGYFKIRGPFKEWLEAKERVLEERTGYGH